MKVGEHGINSCEGVRRVVEGVYPSLEGYKFFVVLLSDMFNEAS